MRGSGGAAAKSSSQDATVLGRAPKPRSSRPPPAAPRRALPHPGLFHHGSGGVNHRLLLNRGGGAVHQLPRPCPCGRASYVRCISLSCDILPCDATTEPIST